MRPLMIPAIVLAALLMQVRFACAQGAATQAIRGAADKLQQNIENQQTPLTTGPKDPQEKKAPGKIDSDAKKEFTATRSGLKFRILRKGKGEKPKASDEVEVHYKGWLDNKTIFDSSYRRNKTTSFPLNRVIRGWTEGLQLIDEGGMIELEIPSELGYGSRGTPGGPIPPNAKLHFLVELVSIK